MSKNSSISSVFFNFFINIFQKVLYYASRFFLISWIIPSFISNFSDLSLRCHLCLVLVEVCCSYLSKGAMFCLINFRCWSYNLYFVNVCPDIYYVLLLPHGGFVYFCHSMTLRYASRLFEIYLIFQCKHAQTQTFLLDSP